MIGIIIMFLACIWLDVEIAYAEADHYRYNRDRAVWYQAQLRRWSS